MIKKVKLFFYIFFESLLPQYNFYHKLPRSKFSYSFKYFFLLIFLLNLLLWLFIFIIFKPLQILEFKNSLSQALAKFPHDLKITIKDGRVSTNYDRPYFLWMDFQNRKILLLVVNENADIQELKKTKSLAMLTNSHLVLDKPETQIYSTANLNLVIDRPWVNNILSELDGFNLFPWLLGLGAVIILILPLILGVFHLFLILPFITAVFLFARLLIKPFHQLSFLKTTQLALHSSTTPIMLYFLLIANKVWLFETNFSLVSLFNLWFPVLVMLFLFIAIYETYYDKTPSPTHSRHHATHPIHHKPHHAL